MLTGTHAAIVDSLSPVKVKLIGSDTAVAAPWHDAAYTPTVGDRVAVVSYCGALRIMGKDVAG